MTMTMTMTGKIIYKVGPLFGRSAQTSQTIWNIIEKKTVSGVRGP